MESLESLDRGVDAASLPESHWPEAASKRLADATGRNHYQGASSEHKSAGFSQSRPLDRLKRVCYFRMEPKTGLRLDQLDGALCTHVILAFARIDARAQLVVMRESDYEYLNGVRQFKRRFPSIRVMISVSNEDEFSGFPMLALSNNELRYTFAKSVIEFLERYELDGVDLHWEYPNFPSNLFNLRGEMERGGLTKMVKLLRSAMVENFFTRQQHQQQLEMEQRSSMGRGNGSSQQGCHNNTQPVEPHLLTVAVGGQETILKSSYELKQLANFCDWLNVMSYDYFLFKPYWPFTGPSSPLKPIVEHYPFLNKLALSWTVQRLLDENLDRDKLVLGVACHARAYRLLFHQTSAPTPFTLAMGTRPGQLEEDQLNYREVLECLDQPETVVEFDERARVPYLLTDAGNTWVSYEDPRSVREKVRFILDKQLGGYMTWSLNSDDFRGASDCQRQDDAAAIKQNGCSSAERVKQATFPLHRAMFDELANYKAPHDQ